MGDAEERLRWRVEAANVNSFPALQQVVDDGWLLRFSGGHGRRTANSATPLRRDHDRIGALVPAAEALYRRQRLPAIFRVPSLIDPAVDAALAARGYGAEGDSLALYGEIGALTAAADPDIRLLPQPTPEWCATVARLQQQDAARSVLYRRIVAGIALPAAFATLAVGGADVAAAYGAMHDGLLCYESVVSDPAQRRRGYAWRVIAALAAWGRDNGAVAGCLQVDADNAPALALYHRFGLTQTLYRYHYRREAAPMPLVGEPASI